MNTTKPLTTRQVKALLKKAHVPTNHLKISRDEIEVFVPDKENPGIANNWATVRLRNQVTKAVGWKGGFKTGYGAWIMQAQPLDMGNYYDPTSRWHY